jgi:hypothetical protein
MPLKAFEVAELSRRSPLRRIAIEFAVVTAFFALVIVAIVTWGSPHG